MSTKAVERAIFSRIFARVPGRVRPGEAERRRADDGSVPGQREHRAGVVPPPPRGPASPRGHGIAQGHRPGPSQGSSTSAGAASSSAPRTTRATSSARSSSRAAASRASSSTRSTPRSARATRSPRCWRRAASSTSASSATRRASRSSGSSPTCCPGTPARSSSRTASCPRAPWTSSSPPSGCCWRPSSGSPTAPSRCVTSTLDTVLEPAPEGEAALSEVRADVWPLLERLDGQRSLKDAIALTRLDEFEAAKTACAMLFLGIVRRKAGGQELDLAEEAQSGFGAEAPVYTAPAAPPAAGGHGLRLPGAARRSSRRSSPSPTGAAETVAFPFVPAEEPEPPPFVVVSAGARAFPRGRPAPSRPRSPGPRASRWTPRRRASPPTPFPVISPSTCPPAPPSLAARRATGSGAAGARRPGDHAASEPRRSRPTREDLAALDALLSPSASGKLGDEPGREAASARSRSSPFRPPTTPPRRAPARAASSARSRGPAHRDRPRVRRSSPRWPRGTSSYARPRPGRTRSPRRRPPRLP